MSNPSQPEYFTVSQAAARLGVSERTLRKRIKAGEVEAEKRPLEGGGVAWHVQLSQDRAGSGTEAERKNEPEANRKSFESENASNRKRDGSEMETAPEVSEPRAGSEPETALLDYLRTENEYLKSQINAWRLQAEAANRTAAETSAALRKALDQMPKALPDESTPSSENEGREDAPQPRIIAQDVQTPTTSKQTRQRQKLTAFQRIGARILGIR